MALWAPGDLAWLSKCIPSKYKIPGDVEDHPVLILHVTPPDKARDRLIWLFVLHSTKSSTPPDPSYIHFRHVNEADCEPEETHKCTTSCTEFLFLQPIPKYGRSNPVAGYVDTNNVFHVPETLVRYDRKNPDRKLRDCSFKLVAELARDSIADAIARWQPSAWPQMLCPKLDITKLQVGQVCWVTSSSGRLVDKEGSSYAHAGPCMVVANASKEARVHIIIDLRESQTVASKFKGIKVDSKKITAPIEPSCTSLFVDQGMVKLSFPMDSMRKNYVSSQSLVLYPSFFVSTDELYELPSCYLPRDTWICPDTLKQVKASLSAKCIDNDGPSDQQRNCMEEEEGEERELLLKKAMEVKHELERAEAERNHQKVLENVKQAISQIHSKITERLAMANTDNSTENDHSEDRYESFLMQWLSSKLLLLAAQKRLEEKGPAVPANWAQHDPKKEARRTRLVSATDAFVQTIGKLFPMNERYRELRGIVKMSDSDCSGISDLANLLPLSTLEGLVREKKQQAEVSSSTPPPTQYPVRASRIPVPCRKLAKSCVVS